MASKQRWIFLLNLTWISWLDATIIVEAAFLFCFNCNTFDHFPARPISHTCACWCCVLVSLWSDWWFGLVPTVALLVENEKGISQYATGRRADVRNASWQLKSGVTECTDGQLDPTETQLESGHKSKLLQTRIVIGNGKAPDKDRSTIRSAVTLLC